MKAEKLITTIEPCEIEIEEIFLFSTEEYEAAKNIIPTVNKWWWLRSPGSRQNRAATVGDDGSIEYLSVDDDYSCVRPALMIRDLKSSNLKQGDNLRIANYSWTVISGSTALCDSTVGQKCFREDWKAEDANVYENSDIKKWLEAWAMENGIKTAAKLVK